MAAVGLRGLKRLAFAPRSDTKIFAATSFGLLVSRDAGRSWFDTDTPLGRVTGLTQHENGETIFAAVPRARRSSDPRVAAKADSGSSGGLAVAGPGTGARGRSRPRPSPARGYR